MVNNNKILTVSYGTFSCTLEGFDDPFSSMKSIADYFRGLAEQDRSFGAEPAAPDAAVVHKIAERESLKQVEAQIDDQGITLRQSDGNLNAQTQKASAAGEGTSTKPKNVTATLATKDMQADDREDEAGAEHDLREDDALSKLSRLRAAAMDDQQISDEFLEDEHAAGSAKSALTDLDDLDEFEELISNHALAPDIETDEESISETAAREAKRQRVKDQIAMNDDEAPETEEPVSASDVDEDAPAGTAVAASPSGDTERSKGTMGDDGQVSRILRVKRKRRSDGEENVVVSQTNTPTSENVEDATVIDVDAPMETAQNEGADLTAEDEADLAAELARVEAEARAELEVNADPVNEPEFATIAPLPPLPLDDSLRVAVQEVSTKSVGDFADQNSRKAPQSELHHEIEALLSTMEAESRVDARRERRAQVFDEQESARDDTALERILAETNTQMDDQNASRRRNSISHLKAAVQATRADKTSGSVEFEEEQETPYRSDLAQAVKPPSPEATAQKTPEPQRTSPLVLISEQRVKETDPEQDTSSTASRDRFVRPRRVNVSTSRKRSAEADPDAEPVHAANSELNAFAVFASNVDQGDTEGYLRAAASFITHSSGMSHFNRPQVVKLVTKLDGPDGISREDALRAFGRLLREGDIIKVAQGCYSLTTVDHGLQTA